MGTRILVSMADLNIACNTDFLTTIGLGSCLGICFYDGTHKVAGMAHAMLPSSEQISNNLNKRKFVDTSITELITKMERAGAIRSRIAAKIFGGAQMFATTRIDDSMRIGDRNIEAVNRILSEMRIPIIAKDVGGNYGRTIIMYAETGIVTVKTVGKGVKDL
ncbi:MAG: chemotaxis protein CheD [Lachnospirales bacterium]